MMLQVIAELVVVVIVVVYNGAPDGRISLAFDLECLSL